MEEVYTADLNRSSEFHHLAAQGIHESSVSFLDPGLKRFGVREHEVPCLGCIQHQELLRCVVPEEQDDKDGGVTGEADVGEDMQHGAGRKHDFSRSGFDERLIETMQELCGDLVRIGRCQETRVWFFSE